MQDNVRLDWPLPAVLRIRLCRPERHNAVDKAVVDGVRKALEKEGRRAGAIVLGADGSFSAGLDLKLPAKARRSVSESLYELYGVMVTHERPIIAAARGHAIGAGAQLLLASDLRVGSPDLVIRFPGPEHGLAVATWALPATVGRGRAIDLALTMREVGSDEALRIGLLDRLVDDPAHEALELARSICSLDREAASMTKLLVTRAAGLNEALAREAQWNSSAGGHAAKP